MGTLFTQLYLGMRPEVLFFHAERSSLYVKKAWVESKLDLREGRESLLHADVNLLRIGVLQRNQGDRQPLVTGIEFWTRSFVPFVTSVPGALG